MAERAPALFTLRSALLLSTGAILAPLLRRLLRWMNGPPALPVPLAFSTCRVHRIKSEAGLRYKLCVSLPHGYEARKSQRYPVLLALDAEPYLFPLLTVVARTNRFFAKSYYYPDVIVVGVVADLESEMRFHRGPGGALDVPLCWAEQRPTRARDYLPTAAESPWGGPNAPSILHISGHASEFIGFLVDTLLPFVDSTYRTRGSCARALVGKSFGGSGVAAALIHPRGSLAFSEFILGSPSIAWDEEAWFRLEREARAAAAANGCAARGSPPYTAGVYCCVGGEKDVDPGLVQRMKAVLDSREGPRGVCDLEVIPGETHGSVSYPFVHHALEWLRPRWASWDAQEGDEKAQLLVAGATTQ